MSSATTTANHKLALRVYIFVSVFAAFLLLIAGWSAYTLWQNQKRFAAIEVQQRITTTDTLEMVRLAGAIKRDVVQVQQYLQDVSATRGQDGLDDGWANAEGYAKAFMNDAKFAQEVAERLKRPDIVKMIEDTKNAFPAVYAEGKKMAQAYVDGGPSAGNPLMKDFDTKVEELGSALNPMVAAVLEFSEKTSAQLKDETHNAIEASRQSALISISLIAMLVLTLGATTIFVRRSILAPMEKLSSTIASLGRISGDSDEDAIIPCVDRGDELGDIARSFVHYREVVKEIEERDLIDRTHRDHERSIMVSQLAEAIQHTAQSADVIASATQQMTNSITEIRNSTIASSQKADSAVSEANKADQRIAALSEAAHRIGSFIETISTIASQTNLLALNATIEAARAGESGKGFAVVAQEVKALASQSSQAAEQITTQVKAIQEQVSTVLDIIRTVNIAITEVNSIGATVASAITEQEATTREIHRNLNELAASTQELTHAVANVSSQTASDNFDPIPEHDNGQHAEAA
jgi:methyl-accepting chemotaxis protein